MLGDDLFVGTVGKLLSSIGQTMRKAASCGLTCHLLGSLGRAMGRAFTGRGWKSTSNAVFRDLQRGSI